MVYSHFRNNNYDRCKKIVGYRYAKLKYKI